MSQIVSSASDINAVTDLAIAGGTPQPVTTPPDVYLMTHIGVPQATGPGINEYSILSIPGAWRAVCFLSETLAGLPKQVFIKQGDTRQRDHNHPNEFLLNDEPSDLATAPTFWETIYHHAIVWGNGYALIDRDGDTITALYNLPPDRIKPVRADGQQWYRVQISDTVTKFVPAYAILHISGLGFDGVEGYPVVKLLAQALGLGKSAYTYSENFFRNGGNIGGSVETDKSLTPEQMADLRNQLNVGYTGLSNTHKWILLQNGLKAKPSGVPPENAQLVEVMQAAILDICRVFKVEPFVCYEYGRATWSNLQSMNTQVVQYSLMPWILKSEAEINRKLFSKVERRQQGYYVAYNVDALERGDHTQQIDSATKRLAQGLSTPDEERALMDLPPYPDGLGTIPRVPANTVPMDYVPQPAATAEPVKASKAEPLPRSTFAPLIAAAGERVATKATKATATAKQKYSKDREGWTIWGNVFAAEIGKDVNNALEPILATMRAAGHDLPQETATKTAERYAARLRSHHARLIRGEASELPDLGELLASANTEDNAA